MMKKLLVLTAVAMLMAGTLGCESCQWFRRGVLFPTVVPEATYSEPCPPCGPCDPCGPGLMGAPYLPGTSVSPPAVVLPGPGPGASTQGTAR